MTRPRAPREARGPTRTRTYRPGDPENADLGKGRREIRRTSRRSGDAKGLGGLQVPLSGRVVVRAAAGPLRLVGVRGVLGTRGRRRGGPQARRFGIVPRSVPPSGSRGFRAAAAGDADGRSERIEERVR